MDRYKRLVSNTMLFGISTFSSKLLGFFLTAYHTRVMGTGDYGSVQAVIDIGSFLIPIVSLGITNAIIRFGLQKELSKKSVYTNGVLTTVAGFFLLLLLAPILNFVPFLHTSITGYWGLLLIFVLTSCLRTVNCQFVRAREAVRLYALDGILCTITNLGFNIFFLSGLKLGAQGLIISLICSDLCSAIFLFFTARLRKYFSLRSIDKKLWSTMLRYALPLMPASIFFWLMNVSGTLFIRQILGPEYTGIFKASYKLPTMLSMVATLFTEAWQLSAFTDDTPRGREQFFSKVFGAYQSVMFIVGGGIILLCKPIMSLFVSPAFFEGWMFIPVLTMATVFSAFDNFLNSIYMVEKRSMLSLVTMAAGAVTNLVLNALLIPIMGVQGAALATLVSFVLVFLLRAVNTRGLIRVDFNPLLLIANVLLLTAEGLMMLTNFPLWPVWCSVMMCILFAINFGAVWDTFKKVFGKKRH